MVQKMKLMFEAVMEAANVMSDTTEEHRQFEKQWSKMGKGMQSFHLALNSDLEMQKQIMEQWHLLRVNVYNLNNNIQNLDKDVNRVREVIGIESHVAAFQADAGQMSSHITSDLEHHRLQAETAQADVTRHLGKVLDVAVRIDRSHENTLAASMALDHHNQVSLGSCLHAVNH
jgi:chromosome segregation ATPase